MSALDTVYAKLPVFAQHLAVSLYGVYWNRLRFGPGYKEFLHGYLDREYFQVDEWAEWQNQRLREVLKGALTTPFYAGIWTTSQKDAALEGRLSDLPLLDKEPIRADPKAFLRTDMNPGNTLTFYTSGSTGTPIAAIYTVDELRDSLAVREARSARWAGVSFSEPRATFSGRMVEPDPESRGPFHRFNLAERQAYLSAFHLRPDTAQHYVDAFRKHKIRWGTGYAVSFYLLARFILENGISPLHLEALITTSEKLTLEMRSVMEQAYGCKIYEEYSTVENVVFASECECGRLHISPDVSVVEILRQDGLPCGPNEAGEVVVTSLSRTYQPLIRFRLGDMAMWDADACPCGRQMPVIKEVVGRIEDVVIGPDRRQMVRFHGVFINQPHVREGQIVQEALDRIRVRVVTTSDFGESDVVDITNRIKQRLGQEVNVIIEPVTFIPRTKAGKFQAVVSNVKRDHHAD